MKIQVDPGRCTGCGICVSLCPFDAIEIRNGIAYFNDRCIACGYCLAHCPVFALSLNVNSVKRGKDAYV